MRDWIIFTCIVGLGTWLMLFVLSVHGFDFWDRVVFGIGVLTVIAGHRWRKWP